MHLSHPLDGLGESPFSQVIGAVGVSEDSSVLPPTPLCARRSKILPQTAGAARPLQSQLRLSTLMLHISSRLLRSFRMWIRSATRVFVFLSIYAVTRALTWVSSALNADADESPCRAMLP